MWSPALTGVDVEKERSSQFQGQGFEVLYDVLLMPVTSHDLGPTSTAALRRREASPMELNVILVHFVSHNTEELKASSERLLNSAKAS